MTNSQKLWLLLAVTVLTLVGMFLVAPIPQDPSFHRFADTRPLWGIPNFGNVISNLPFLVIGLYGRWVVARAGVPVTIRWIYLPLFAGVLFTGLGSAYYHWNPDNDTLVLGRMPMTIVFMCFLSAMISELVNRRLGFALLVPLLALGAGSVIWWHYTETLGRGDLRLYFWVQFFPMLAVVLMLWLFYEPGIKPVLRTLVWIVVWYAVVKVFEFLDYPIYDAVGVSRHTLKHLAAAVSTGWFVVLFRQKYGGKVNTETVRGLF